MVEFALIAPTFFLLMFGIMEFGLLMFDVASSRYAAGEAAKVEATAGNVSLLCENVPACLNLGGGSHAGHHVGDSCDADCQAIASINRSPLGTTSLQQVLYVEIQQCDAATATCPATGTGTYTRRNLDDTCSSNCGGYPAGLRSTTFSAPEYLRITIHYRYNWKTGLVASIAPPPVLDASFLLRIEPQKF
jgi:hypothetical protein